MSPPPRGLLIDKDTKIYGKVIIEPPFLTQARGCVLNNFKGGAFSSIGSDCSLVRTIIGRYCSIADNVRILGRHPCNALSSHAVFYAPVFGSDFFTDTPMSFSIYEQTYIGHDVWLGSGVKLKTGVKIGNGAIVGAGSVVTKDVAAFSIVGGVPAKLIRMRFSPQLIVRLETLAWWDYQILQHQVCWDNLESAVSTLEQLKTSGQLSRYIAPQLQLWCENTTIFAKHFQANE